MKIFDNVHYLEQEKTEREPKFSDLGAITQITTAIIVGVAFGAGVGSFLAVVTVFVKLAWTYA